jgi:phosphocarrier protein HPr
LKRMDSCFRRNDRLRAKIIFQRPVSTKPYALCSLRSTDMDVQTFTIKNRLGLHARAAALLVKTANKFASELTIEKDGLEVNGKSIMGILMLAASKGTKITLKVEGRDSVQALQTLGRLIENKFGEE